MRHLLRALAPAGRWTVVCDYCTARWARDLENPIREIPISWAELMALDDCPGPDGIQVGSLLDREGITVRDGDPR